MPRLCRSRVTSCAKSEFFITIVFSLVGTRGSVEGMWGPCACPLCQLDSQEGQAQGPHPPSPPLLVPTDTGGSILLATALIMHEILLAGNISLSKEGHYT